MKLELMFVSAQTTRHGKKIYYFRRGQSPRVRLRGAVLSRQFMESYWAALEAVPENEVPAPRMSLRKPGLIIAPKAAKSQVGEQGDSGVVYFVQGEKSGLIKIGYSSNVLGRLDALATGSSEKLRLLGAIKGTFSDEAALHRRFMEFQIKGEWFKNAPALLAYIREKGADAAKAIVSNPWDYDEVLGP